MADNQKVDIKLLLGSVVLVKGGKVVKTPTSDNYEVHPAKGSPLALMPPQAIVLQLEAAYPKCVFTWFSSPIEILPEK